MPPIEVERGPRRAARPTDSDPNKKFSLYQDKQVSISSIALHDLDSTLYLFGSANVNRPMLLCAALVSSLFTHSVSAAETVVVTQSRLSPEALWKKVGDFCGIQAWQPIVRKCELSGDGRLRTLTVKGDDTLTGAVKNYSEGKAPPRELGALAIDLLEGWDDAKRCYSYTLVYGEAPIANYHSTICVVPTADGSAIRWSGRYTTKPGVSAATARKFLLNVYRPRAAALVGS
jgi:hypothetical protein